MFHFFSLALSFAVGIAGLLLIYASMSYENEDGEIQNLLEEWWLKIDDLREQALSAHIAFMKVIASMVTRILDRIFGSKVLSPQSLGVSLCLSLLWIGIGMMALHYWKPQPQSTGSESAERLILFGLGYGILPAFIPKKLWALRKNTWINFWFYLLLIIVAWTLYHDLFDFLIFIWSNPEFRLVTVVIISTLVGIIFGMFLFTAFIGLMRATVRKITLCESSTKIIGIALLNVAPIVTFYVLFRLARWSEDYSGRFENAVIIFAYMTVVFGIVCNLAFVLSATLFAGLSTTMLLHRLFWPAIQRPLYKLQALGIAKRPKVFAAIGLMLLGVAFGKHEWLTSLIDKF